MAKVELDIEELIKNTFEEHFGVTIDRLRELAEADRDGRCVVLPCNVGDIVYVITQVFNGNKIERAIGSRKIDRIGGNALNPVWVVSTQPYELHFLPSEFGKTVFLTRDEAAEAERDAATKYIPHICCYCKKDYYSTGKQRCEKQKEDGIHAGAYTCGEFEWRGQQAGKGAEHD